ncbi:hypothetical protein VE03_00443 [Pseudogymnoascus sp. 23342-1-I1]|nr:hypothetical protein VE03_00443 [Pseudogymnoascus sp. 23342-1-I1]
MPPQTSCAPCTLTFSTRLALRSHIRRSDSHPNCLPCHRSFVNDHALATHLAQSRFHSNSSAHTTTGSTGSAVTGKRRRRRGRSGSEGGDEPTATMGDSECGDYGISEKQTASKTSQRVLISKTPRALHFPFRRSPRRILPSGRLHAIPRPVSVKRLVSAVVLRGPQFLVMVMVMVVFVVGVRGFCAWFGCGFGYGCYAVVRI